MNWGCSGTGANSQKEAAARAFQKCGVAYEVRKLAIGDYVWICKPRPGVVAAAAAADAPLVLPFIVERKRLDDLASSIKDGRFKEQKVITGYKARFVVPGPLGVHWVVGVCPCAPGLEQGPISGGGTANLVIRACLNDRRLAVPAETLRPVAAGVPDRGARIAPKPGPARGQPDPGRGQHARHRRLPVPLDPQLERLGRLPIAAHQTNGRTLSGIRPRLGSFGPWASILVHP